MTGRETEADEFCEKVLDKDALASELLGRLLLCREHELSCGAQANNDNANRMRIMAEIGGLTFIESLLMQAVYLIIAYIYKIVDNL